MAVFGRTALALIWAGLVFMACCLRGPVVLFLTAPARYLGTISYGIYLWHLPVIMTLHLRVTWLDGQHALPYVVILTCFLASGSWHFFERPFMERAKALVKARKEAAGSKWAVIPQHFLGILRRRPERATTASAPGGSVNVTD